eukprot:1352159-Rhodomonas_salina.1
MQEAAVFGQSVLWTRLLVLDVGGDSMGCTGGGACCYVCAKPQRDSARRSAYCDGMYNLGSSYWDGVYGPMRSSPVLKQRAVQRSHKSASRSNSHSPPAAEDRKEERKAAAEEEEKAVAKREEEEKGESKRREEGEGRRSPSSPRPPAPAARGVGEGSGGKGKEGKEEREGERGRMGAGASVKESWGSVVQ